jgi:hypothetical protein
LQEEADLLKLGVEVNIFGAGEGGGRSVGSDGRRPDLASAGRAGSHRALESRLDGETVLADEDSLLFGNRAGSGRGEDGSELCCLNRSRSSTQWLRRIRGRVCAHRSVLSGGIGTLGVEGDLTGGVVSGRRGASEGEGDSFVGGGDGVRDGPEDDAVGAGEDEGLGGVVCGGC